MKHSSHLPTASEALRRVFFPSLHSHPPLFPLHHHHHRPIHFKSRRPTPPSEPTPTPLTDLGPPRDEAIAADLVRLVNPETNTLQPPEPVSTILSYIDRKLFSLVQVSPPTTTTTTTTSSNPRFSGRTTTATNDFPVCKILPKSLLRQQLAAKLRPPASARNNPKADKNTKQLEVGWGIDANDLRTRMRQMRGFLEEGRRVEVVLGKRRKGWMGKRSVPVGEMEGLLGKIRGAAGEVEGAREWKGMEGEMGAQATLFLEGPAVKKKKKGQEKERGEEKEKD